MKINVLARNFLRHAMMTAAGYTLFSRRKGVRSVGFEVISEHQSMLVCTSDRGEYFIVKSGDEWIERELFVNGTFDFRKFENALELIAQHRPGWMPRTLIDVGANIGTICIPAIARGHFERALAIEAEADNARILRANIVLNRLEEKITVIHAAAGAKDDEMLTLEVATQNFGDHRIRVTDEPGIQGEADRQLIQVPSSSLDTLASDVSPSGCMIWMDVQGFEGIVLTGASKLLAAKPPMVLEFSPYLMNRTASFSALLASLSGYSSFVDLNGDKSPRPIADLPALHDSFARTEFTDILIV